MVLWTPEHIRTLLPSLVVIAIVTVLLRKLLIKKPLSIRMIPIQVLAVFIILLEIGKQAVSFSRGYDLYHIPLHYCSLLIFTLPVMAFYRGKHRQTVNAVTATVAGAMTLLTVIYPSLIYSADNIRQYFNGYLDFHTVTFHTAVILIFALIVALDVHTVQPKGETKAVTLVAVVFCVVSASMAQLLKTNYANFYSCNIPPLENVRLAVRDAMGVMIAQLFYVIVVSVLTVLFTLMCYWLYRLLKGKSKAQQEISI